MLCEGESDGKTEEAGNDICEVRERERKKKEKN